MEYLIDKYETSEDSLNQGLMLLQRAAGFTWWKTEYDYHVRFYCNNCGAQLYGDFSRSFWSPREWMISGTSSDAIYRKYQEEFEYKEMRECNERCLNAAKITQCPICGAQLSRENGYFWPPDCYGDDTEYPYMQNVFRKELQERFGENIGINEGQALLREAADRAQAKEEVSAYTKSCDLFVAEKESIKVSETKADSDQLKKYILHLSRLENNIYALEQRLSELYYQRIHNNRSVVLGVCDPIYMLKTELKELQTAYQKAVEEVSCAEAYQPEVSVDYPVEPAEPVLGKPGLFNKKKVLAENDALTANYQAEMDAYHKEVRRCDDEKARLIAEKRAAVIGEAQAKAGAAKAALDEAERSKDDKIKALESRPVPAKGVKEVLDKEIAEVEDLLKKTFAARNELYAYDIIFRKYRDAVALSSFYEYLMSGRCTSLEGSDGAYNIYESEIRANRVIAQLDTVISSLEDIKQNQYMMYEELCSINSSLEALNRTMGKALTSIQSIEANTTSMNDYMAHISKNSDVIAHNTAVTAHYSKINAQLTNALGYMVAFG